MGKNNGAYCYQCVALIVVLAVLGMLTPVLMVIAWILAIAGVILLTALVTTLFWKYMARRRGHPALAVAIIVATIALAGMTFIPGSWWFITIAYVPAFLAWLVDKIAPRLPRFHVARTTRTRSRSTRPGPWAWTRRHRNEAVRVAASDTAVKTQLLGMIKASPRGLSIMDASKLLHLPSDRVKVLIYELIGTGQIEGTFTSKQLFMPRTSIEDAVASNEQHFARWDEASRNKDGKL